MGSQEEVDLPVEQSYEIVREFLIAKQANIDEDASGRIKATHGSVFSWSRQNAKKKITFKIERSGEEKSFISLDVSFLQENISAVVQFLIVLFITMAAMVIPIFGIILFIVAFIPSLIVLAWSFTGRGKFENDFWEYLDVRIPRMKQKAVSPIFSMVGKSESELKRRLEEIEDELINGKISESDYKKLKRHIEIEIEDLDKQKSGARKSPI